MLDIVPIRCNTATLAGHKNGRNFEAMTKSCDEVLATTVSLVTGLLTEETCCLLSATQVDINDDHVVDDTLMLKVEAKWTKTVSHRAACRTTTSEAFAAKMLVIPSILSSSSTLTGVEVLALLATLPVGGEWLTCEYW